MTSSRRRSAARGLVLVLVTALLLSGLAGVAAAEERAGGTVVVAEGETIEGDLEAFGGSIIVRGTVDGDLEAFGGDVRIEGEVTGDVDAAAGNVWLGGAVGGNVDVAAGNVYVEPGATIGGRLSAAAGNIVVGGAVAGNANLAGGTVTLAETATVGGNVEYAADADGFTNRGTVAGSVTRVEDLSAGPWRGPVVPPRTLDVNGFLANLALGAVLLLGLPRVSAEVAARVTTDPLRTGGAGLVAVVLVPILLVLLLVSIVGIPLALLGAVGFAVLLWVGLVYGRYAVGVWLLSLADVENRWLGLVVGLLLLGLAGRIPVLGGLLDVVVGLLGVGAVAAIAYGRVRARRATR